MAYPWPDNTPILNRVLSGSRKIQALDPVTGATLIEITLGAIGAAASSDLALSPDRLLIYSLNEQFGLQVIDTPTFTLQSSQQVVDNTTQQIANYIATDASGNIYVSIAQKSVGQPKFYSVKKFNSALVEQWQKTAPFTIVGTLFATPPIEVSADGSTLFYSFKDGSNTTKNTVHVYDLVNDIQLTDLAVTVDESVQKIQRHPTSTDIFVLTCHSPGGVGLSGGTVRRYQTDGTLVTTYVIAAAATDTVTAFGIAPDGLSFWTRWDTLDQWRVSDGANLVSISADLNGYIGVGFGLGVFAEPNGTIIVTKHASSQVESPVTRNFFFTTTGLTPASFNLTNGVSRTFSEVPPTVGGGTAPIYLIQETDDPRYRTTSVVVSNDSDPGLGLEVNGGETVTVDFYQEDRAVPVPIRRLRRFRLVNDEKLRMFCRRLEFDFQPGLGTTGDLADSGVPEGSDPTVMLRISRDGGQTWGEEIDLHIGAVGEYLTRCFVTNLGSYRNGVAELYVTDAVTGWYLAQVYGTFEVGNR